MTTEDLIRDIHRDVQKTSVTVAALDERSKGHTGQIKVIQDDVKSVQKTVSKLDERTNSHKADIKTLETDVKRTASKTALMAGGGTGGTVLLISKLWEWLNGAPKS